jgi:hypothetical protein
MESSGWDVRIPVHLNIVFQRVSLYWASFGKEGHMRIVLLGTLLIAAVSVYYLGRTSANTASYGAAIAKNVGD